MIRTAANDSFDVVMLTLNFVATIIYILRDDGELQDWLKGKPSSFLS